MTPFLSPFRNAGVDFYARAALKNSDSICCELTGDFDPALLSFIHLYIDHNEIIGLEGFL